MPLTIFSRPDWNDTATQWGTYWEKRLIDSCPTDKLELYKEQARRAPNEAAIKANPTAFYYGFGHGNASVFTGQSQEVVIDASNVSLWNQAWVHLLSCSVFAGLGLKFPHGSGYKGTFYFYVGTFPNSYAEPYFDSDQQYIKALWAGKSAGEAQKALQDAFNAWYDKCPPEARGYLDWDRSIHVITGDPNDRPTPAKDIVQLLASYSKDNGPTTFIGELTKGADDSWSLPWKIPDSGSYVIWYTGTDQDGNHRVVATGAFTVNLPESPIEIVPEYPKGGEIVTTRTISLQVTARYVE